MNVQSSKPEHGRFSHLKLEGRMVYCFGNTWEDEMKGRWDRKEDKSVLKPYMLVTENSSGEEITLASLT